MYRKFSVLFLVALARANEDLQDFDFNHDEIMIAQESRQYQTIVKPPIKIFKPTGVTNSHRPQYNIDSEEDLRLNRADFDETKKFEKLYRPSYKRAKEGMIRDAVLRALERKDHVGKFAQILPIIRSMSGSQRVALASLVASQVTTPPGRAPLNLAQVRSMFGSQNSTTDLMLPILLDMANLIRRAVRPGKQTREVKQNLPLMARRSDIDIDDEPFETYEEQTTAKTQNTHTQRRRLRPQRTQTPNRTENRNDTENRKDTENITDSNTIDTEDATVKNSTRSSSSTTEPSSSPKVKFPSLKLIDNSTLDLTADSTNNTLAQDLPTAEKLRSMNRYVDRKGNIIRRTYPKPSPPLRRTTAEPTVTSLRRRPAPRKPTVVDGHCELFTNSLCLNAEDYPTDAIVQSIRRNKAAAGALLADYRDPGDGAVDGVSAQQEAKYTPEHYLVSNRRGDTANRDFAGAGEAGFMCPSIVKYARPQRARATSGQWKYIVNTGEHTQTLRLEKCLKPKDSCTYLTDNFKSKCVQVYNYHRLLTWDQQNGLHMDIFKVPTCCSCHIEGYSVNFPPLGHRVQETSSENFPGEDLSPNHGNNAFEAVQSSIQRPSITKNPPPFLLKPLEQFPSINENHNLISNQGFSNAKLADTDQYDSNMPTGPVDSYGTSYFPDSFNQASSSIRNVKRPPSRKPGSASHDLTLPSYLEPPTPASPASFSFVKELPSKYKITNSNQFKRGAPRPNRRPIRKKISAAPDDLMSSGTVAVESFTSASIESLEDFNDDLEEPDVITPGRVTIAPKLPSVPLSSETPVLSSTHRPKQNTQKQRNAAKDQIGPNGKRVNYNYHPIIDFFEGGGKEEENDSIDREDSEPEYSPAVENEWKPINHPVSRTQNNQLGRKKHK